MDHLKPAKGRTRALSVTNATDSEKKAMNTSLDDLNNDLGLIEAQWNRVITRDTNPLELALAFLDNTSVGLGHRYQEFNHLKNQIANDLQQAVNEHYQAFNSNVASYGQTVQYITESQGNISKVRETIDSALNKISSNKGSLEELNETSIRHANMLEIFNVMEQLILIPDKVEGHINDRNFKNAQETLERGFSLASSHKLWSLQALQTTKQQLELQEHSLFETLIEEVQDIIYSKKVPISPQNGLFKDSISEHGFSSLENYLHHVINVDITEQSKKINKMLTDFLEKLAKNSSEFGSTKWLTMEDETDYDRLFTYLTTLNNMNKLHTALDIFIDRSKEELHDVVRKAIDNLRLKHPSLLKMVGAVRDSSDFGLSGKDILSVILRDMFWEIFTKFLLSFQAHRAIYEITKNLQPPASNNMLYNLEGIWGKTLDEAKTLVTSYIDDSSIYDTDKNLRHRKSSASAQDRQSVQGRTAIFSLQSNIEDSATAKDHANELRTLLKDMFPGFTMSSNLNLESIYLEEEAFEQEDTIIPPTVFNMKVILESFLVFVQGTSKIVPTDFEKHTKLPIAFFHEYMGHNFLPRLERTLNYLFEKHVESNAPYALETVAENRTLFKTGLDFKNLFSKILYVMNTSHNYRENITDIILSLLNKLYVYYANIFQGLLGSVNNHFNKKIITSWLEDVPLMMLTKKIVHGDDSFILGETERLFQHCPHFYIPGKGLDKRELFNNITLDTVTYFLSTLTWINTWLVQLRKEVEPSSTKPEDLDADSLRGNWSFFEAADFEKVERLGNLKLSLAGKSLTKFNELFEKFESLETKLLTCLRYDVRARSIYYISKVFETSKWDPEVASIELNPNISTLTSELSMIENNLRQRIPKSQEDVVFRGISVMGNHIFIAGSQAISVLNEYGIKKLLRNVNVLQQTYRGISGEPEKVDMSKTIKYFGLCSLNENTLIDQYNENQLSEYTYEEVKNVLRLQFSEELRRQMKRQSGSRVMSMSANKRYTDALKKLKK